MLSEVRTENFMTLVLEKRSIVTGNTLFQSNVSVSILQLEVHNLKQVK